MPIQKNLQNNQIQIILISIIINGIIILPSECLENDIDTIKQNLMFLRTKKLLEDYFRREPQTAQDSLENEYYFKSNDYDRNLFDAIKKDRNEIRVQNSLSDVVEIKVVERRERITREEIIIGNAVEDGSPNKVRLGFSEVTLGDINDITIRIFTNVSVIMQQLNNIRYIMRWQIRDKNSGKWFFIKTPIVTYKGYFFYDLDVTEVIKKPAHDSPTVILLLLNLYPPIKISKVVMYIRKKISIQEMYKNADMNRKRYCEDIISNLPLDTTVFARNQKLSCCLKTFRIHASSLGLENLKKPKIVNLNYCAGNCFLNTHSRRLDNFNIINLLNHVNSSRLSPLQVLSMKPCCGPSRYFSLELSFKDNYTEIIPNVIAADCACP